MSKYMRKVDVKVERYCYTDRRTSKIWYVDIIDGDNMGYTVDMFEAYIAPVMQYHDYGKMMYMFGMPKVQSNGHNGDHDGFMEMVENNIDDYIDIWEDWVADGC